MKKKDDIPRLEAGERINIDIDLSSLNVKRKKRFSIIALFLTVLTVLLLFITLKVRNDADKKPESSVDASVNDALTWQGAFESEKIFNDCREASVSIMAQGRRCSGFVYSSDGWIVTVEGVVNENVKGRIEVFLFDGSAFLVEAFKINRQSGLVLMKIDASGLKSVNIDKKSEPFVGEELFTFCAIGDGVGEGSLFSGRVAHTQRAVGVCRSDGRIRTLKLVQVAVLLTEDGVGAPFFDESGALVGIACADGGEEERYIVDYAFSFSAVKPILEAMKIGETLEVSEDFSEIFE